MRNDAKEAISKSLSIPKLPRIPRIKPLTTNIRLLPTHSTLPNPTLVPTSTCITLLLLHRPQHAFLQPLCQLLIRAATYFRHLHAPNAQEQAQHRRIASVVHGLPDAKVEVLGARKSGGGLRHGEARVGVEADGELPALDL